MVARLSSHILTPRGKKVEITDEDIKAVAEKTGASEDLVRRVASFIEKTPRTLGIPKTFACLRCRLMLPIPIISTVRRIFWCLLCRVLPE
jgi:hypothetical protein